MEAAAARLTAFHARQSASSASLGGELSQRDAGTNETSGLNTQRARSLSSITRPLMAQLRQGRIAVARVSDVTVESANAGESEGAVMPLAMQERPLELALNQPTLGSHESQEVTLAQLPGTSIELGSSRRDQRRPGRRH